LFAPAAAVFGSTPAAGGFSPEQWGDVDIVTERLAPGFDDIELRTGLHRWEFDSVAAALHWVRAESPVHVTMFRYASAGQQEQLTAAFEAAFRPHVDAAGAVSFTSPYAVVSAVRRP
jgi:hypothetical protein